MHLEAEPLSSLIKGRVPQFAAALFLKRFGDFIIYPGPVFRIDLLIGCGGSEKHVQVWV